MSRIAMMFGTGLIMLGVLGYFAPHVLGETGPEGTSPTALIPAVIGAILLSTIQQIVTVTVSSEMNVLVVGVLLVFFVVAAPEGIMGLFRKWKNRSSR